MDKNCPVCNFKFHSFIKSQTHFIYKCKNCGLGKTVNLKPHYGNYHRDQQYIEDEDLFENIFQKRVRILDQLRSSGTVLEVGCSTGLMLNLLKIKGYLVEGVEISKPAVKIALKRGINVIKRPFEDVKTRKKFDIIIFNHTLEHLKDPFGAISKSSELLREKGIIYIDLPNFDGLESKIFKSNWPYLLPDEHLWHFTYNSLLTILEKNKLKIIFDERASGIWDLENPLRELKTTLLTLKKRFIANLLGLVPNYIETKLKIGNDLMVVATKND